MKKPKTDTLTTEIAPIKTRRLIVNLVGTSPLIMHRYALKAWQELLYPSKRKNAAERDASLKHEPLEEYRGCFYLNRDDKTPSLFHLPGGMIHKAMSAAALDMPGTTKAEMERLTSVTSPQINLFGVPRLGMDMVRSSDMARTPDVRTRPYFPRWACTAEIEYKCDPLTDTQILNLLAAAGRIVGLGDWRPQRRGGPHGKFRLAAANDKEFADIVKKEGRAAQQAAYNKPEMYSLEAEELYSWFTAEVARRRQDGDDEVSAAVVQ